MATLNNEHYRSAQGHSKLIEMEHKLKDANR
jgi:hypothetical protein